VFFFELFYFLFFFFFVFFFFRYFSTQAQQPLAKGMVLSDGKKHE
jgi:hypothetical protein